MRRKFIAKRPIQNHFHPTINHCKVPECHEKHFKHYCKNCQSDDSSHFSYQCPRINPNFVINNRCKVHNCTENHTRHFCLNCLNPDSDHFKENCTFSSKCGIAGCKEDHKTHYCIFCSKPNQHFSINCPEAKELFHATKISCLDGIAKEGLQAGKVKKHQNPNRFGNGIYFAGKKECINMAENLYGKEGVVLRCRVHLKNCKYFGNSNDSSGKWADHYDSVIANHPTWFHGVTQNGFREYVLKNGKYCKVYEIIKFVNGEKLKVRMTDYQNDDKVRDQIRRI